MQLVGSYISEEKPHAMKVGEKLSLKTFKTLEPSSEGTLRLLEFIPEKDEDKEDRILPLPIHFYRFEAMVGLAIRALEDKSSFVFTIGDEDMVLTYPSDKHKKESKSKKVEIYLGHTEANSDLSINVSRKEAIQLLKKYLAFVSGQSKTEKNEHLELSFD